MRSTFFRLVSRFVVLAAVCGLLAAGSTAAGASTRAAQPQKGGTMTFMMGTDTQSTIGWDPIRLRGVPTYEDPQAFAMYDALLYEDPVTFKVTPRIATSLTSSDNGLTWTLKLRSGVKFADGTPFDATAVQYNWQRIADPANRAAASSSASVAATMDVVDPLTLKTTLKSPDPNWDRRVAETLAWIGSPTAIKAMGATAFGFKPVGAGPFVLQEWVKDSQQTFVRNSSYWRKDRPYLDSIVVKFIPDETQRYSTFSTAGGNYLQSFAPTTIEQAKQAGYKLIPMSAVGGGWALTFNVQKAPFTDVRVRSAIDMAIDRQQFMETRRLGDKQYLMDTLDRPETPFYDPKIKVPKYDLAGAQKLIDQVVAEQGGKPVQFTVTTFSTSYIVSDAELLQAQLNKLKNVEMKIEVLAATEVIRKYNAGEQQAVIQGPRWNEPAIDMVNWFSSTSNFNYMRYSNPTVDAALKQLVTATDQKTREQLVHQVEQQVLKDAPVVWYLRFPSNGIIDQKTVKDFKAYYDQRYLLDDVWLKAKKG